MFDCERNRLHFTRWLSSEQHIFTLSSRNFIKLQDRLERSLTLNLLPVDCSPMKMMDVKKEMDDGHCGEPEEKAKEHHGHQFSWKFGKEDLYNVVCKKAGTIYESLQNSDTFKVKASENQGKELVILTHKKAISSHFPCHKMTELDIETLTIMYISAGGNQTTTTSSKDKKENHGEMVIFYIKTTGGTNILTKVMKNVGLRKIADEVIVYGYKGQTVREALEQDGRFSDEVFQINYFLEDTEVNKRTEMSSPVDFLDGKYFKITKPKLRKSIGAAKHDAPQEATSSKTTSSDVPPPHQHVSNQPTPNASHQPSPNTSHQPSSNTSHQPTPNKSDQLNREEVYQLLRSQFPDLTKRMKRRKDANGRDVRQLFSREFGKNVTFCKKAKTMRKFLELGDSVCQVRIGESAAGSGFLLFGKYILTNAHVVLDEEKTNLRENITVIFAYEDLTVNKSLSVTVVGATYLVEKDGYKQDWALLEVCGDINTLPVIPQPLLKHFGLVKKRGQICIVGHPEGGVKMIDPCFTIPREEFEKHRPNSVNFMYRDIHTYETSFYHGSSGSPVFDIDFKVVSMHTGGFDYEKKVPAIEYSHPLSGIIMQIIIQIVRNKTVHVLLAMITCGIPEEVMAGVKEMFKCNSKFVWTEDEMINLTESFCERDQELLKGFFRFFQQRDEPMDTSS